MDTKKELENSKFEEQVVTWSISPSRRKGIQTVGSLDMLTSLFD